MDTDTIELPRGASTWEREIFQHLSTHAAREGAMLAEYVREAERTGSRALAYVIGILADDERRHHAQMADLLRSLVTDAELRSDDPAVPRLDFDRVDTSEVLALTRRLIEEEKQDVATLKQLRKQFDDVADTTLWALLVDTMRLDTEKHLAILKFVEKQARRRRS